MKIKIDLNPYSKITIYEGNYCIDDNHYQFEVSVAGYPNDGAIIDVSFLDPVPKSQDRNELKDRIIEYFNGINK